LINPMLQNFFAKTSANFPWCDVQLNIDWIFDGCVEALGSEIAMDFFDHLKEDLKKSRLKHIEKKVFVKRLNDYIEQSQVEYYKPLPLLNAIERYTNWEKLNPMATHIAMEQTIDEVYHLYRLDRFPEIARYHLYRHTYFSNSDPSVQNAFDKLLNAMITNRKKPAVQFLELSDLQGALTNSNDRDIFSRMVFPYYQRKEKLEVLKIGENEREQVIVHSTITDKYGNTYTFRAPVEPAEIGQLYRIFFNENFPKQISEQDKHFVVIDAQEKVVGGICYQIQEKQIAQIEGTVVSSPVKERGIGKAIIEHFCNRMTSQDIHVIKAHFFFRPFYEKLGFHVDKQWGALVKFLTPESKLEEIT
jgi:predicted GNAT family acetyltransferase